MTNFRLLEKPYGNLWREFGHGGALAAVAHLLSTVLIEVRIASILDYENLFPWGSHPLIDPLFSSSNLSVIHIGAVWSRVEKTRLISDFDEALATLHVCYKLGDSANCSHCSKCVRTMLTLECLGGRNRATSFNWSRYIVKDLEPILLNGLVDRAFLADVDRAATLAGRDDIREFISRSIVFTKGMRIVPKQILHWGVTRTYIRLLKRTIQRSSHGKEL